MATLNELRQLFSNSDLRNRIESACIKAAYEVLTEDATTENHAQRQKWAVQAFSDPRGTAKKMLMVALAANAGADVAGITGASDGEIETAVSNAIELFALQL